MANWLGDHREFYALFVALCSAALWIAANKTTLRQLIAASRHREPASPELIKRGANAVAFAVFGVFTATQIALAADHIWLSAWLEYSIWFACGLMMPLAAQSAIERIALRSFETKSSDKLPLRKHSRWQEQQAR